MTTSNTIQERAEKMILDIDGNMNRESRKVSLDYDLEAMKFLVKNELVSVKGNIVSRFGFGTNSKVVYNF